MIQHLRCKQFRHRDLPFAHLTQQVLVRFLTLPILQPVQRRQQALGRLLMYGHFQEPQHQT